MPTLRFDPILVGNQERAFLSPSIKAAIALGVNVMLWAIGTGTAMLRYGGVSGFRKEFPAKEIEGFFDPVLIFLLFVAALVLITCFRIAARKMRLRSERANAKAAMFLSYGELASLFINSGSFFFVYAILFSPGYGSMAAVLCWLPGWGVLRYQFSAEG